MPYKNPSHKIRNRKEYRVSATGRAKIRAWAQSERGREGHRDYNLRRRYGVTLAQFKKLYDSQKGLCAICKVHMTTGITQAHLDHNHMTGQIRELLCRCCNGGLGLFKDNTDTMQRAIDYLGKHKSLERHKLPQ